MAALLQDYSDCRFDFDMFDYQLIAYTNDFERMKAEGGYAGLYAPPRILPAFPDAKRVKAKSPVSEE
jgi:hypothetical protein